MSLQDDANLLSTENKDEFRRVLDGVMSVFRPIDPVKENLVKHYVYDSWLIDRLHRHSTAAIERRFQQTRSFRLERAKVRMLRAEERARAKLVMAGTEPSDISHLVALETQVEGSVDQMKGILNAAATENDHNVAFEGSMAFLEALDRMLQNAHRRRRDTLQLLDFYEAGLAHRASAAAERALKENGPKEEAVADLPDAPSIIPTSHPEDNHVVEPQNRSEPTQ